MDDDQFFAAPPADDALPVGDDGGFTFLGDAGETAPPADYVGDVQESDDMGFAGAPADDAFGAPPADDDFGMAPVEDAPIVLGPPPEAPEESPDAFASGADEPAAVEAIVSVAGPMQKWNEEWQLTLAARKDEENAKKAELLEAARVALEEFQKERELKREARMSKNREDEQAKLEAIEADLENDSSWQRVCKMVDLTHDGAEAGEDTKRMRDVFILLKNEQGLAAKVGA
ncbi:clathrin light chain [Nitzschia inconspicua]|uniref:Clathrin light chain n=1 Tax=Nitzschia inconspicua TaxID=303405 RepID=A0A9K3LWB9_9STRA|nr:clathrin light chain [Nitzschia inconspicua]